ncbi:MAG: hypothetical protein HYV26_12860 [Candidatus Hydrogenedentes bacterium]|nr:hypothetical protein [Candidatus Hydrogenedentota bacterium]
MEPSNPPRRSDRNQILVYLTALGVYTAVVYGGSLSVFPLGADYVRLAHPELLWKGQATLLKAEMALFGTSIPAWHLFNVLLLYLCSVCVFFLTRALLGRPLWLASSADVLFMANPAKSEVVYNLTGALHLAPALAGLLSLFLYARSRQIPGHWRYVLALLLFVLAVHLERTMAALTVPLLLLHVCIGKAPARGEWLRGLTAIAVAGYLFLLVAPPSEFYWPALAPLLLVVYPIGLLPSTVALCNSYPILVWAAVVSTAGLLAVIHWGARHPVFLYGVTGAVGVALFGTILPVDLVHMIGGGQLLVPMALIHLALAALCQSILRHPKWRKLMVLLTAIWCVVFFVLQVRMGMIWKEAGTMVQQAQEEVAALARNSPGETIGLAPDYQYYQGAPFMLSAALSFDTPFSTALPVQSVFPLHLAPDDSLRVGAFYHEPAKEALVLHGPLAKPYTLMTSYTFGGFQALLPVLPADIEYQPADDAVTVTIKPRGAHLPDQLYTFHIQQE